MHPLNFRGCSTPGKGRADPPTMIREVESAVKCRPGAAPRFVWIPSTVRVI